MHAAEQLGIMIPRFCYHPGLGSFGACRMCAVKFLEGPVKGIEMSCMEDAQDGMVVSTTDPEAMEFRRYVIEWLMMHHPLDCPVCDEGGHCLLQDETVSGGHGIRRYLGPKRTYQDQYLGAFVQHEMNRCIHCWRCRSFYQEFAGYRDYGAMQIANRMYFGRYENGPLESPFAGNLIDVCPTGVLTDKPARFIGRRWDFERAPSLCLHCSLGCNTMGSARYRQMWRMEGRFNEMVNGYFICDRGRFGFAYASHPERPRRARIAGVEVELAGGDPGGRRKTWPPRGSLRPRGRRRPGFEPEQPGESGELKRFCRTLGWTEPRYFSVPSHGAQGQGRGLPAGRGPGRIPARAGSGGFYPGGRGRPLNEAPMLALALRQAWRKEGKVVVLDPRPVSLPFEFEHLPVAPGQIDAAMSVVAAAALQDKNPEDFDPGAQQFLQTLPRDYGLDRQIGERLTAIGQKLGVARRPVIICGTDVVRESTPALAADLVRLLREAGLNAGLFYLLPGANAFGAALMSRADTGPTPLVEALEAGAIKALLAVECDPFWDYPDRERLARALKKLELLVVLDYLPSPLVQRADIVLPTLTVFERSPSSFVNQEGRLQLAPPVHLGGSPLPQISPELHPPRTFLSHVPGGEPRTPGEILTELAAAMSPPAALPVADLWDWLGREQAVFANMVNLFSPPPGARLLPEALPAGAYAPAALSPRSRPRRTTWNCCWWTRPSGREELASYSRYHPAGGRTGPAVHAS